MWPRSTPVSAARASRNSALTGFHTATRPAPSSPSATGAQGLMASDRNPAAAASDSPTNFPLVETGEQRGWPRSELVNASSDPSIEAYLVRHNQMIAEDGLGGFVPYVDVVSNSQPAANADAAPATGDDAAQGNDGQ